VKKAGRQKHIPQRTCVGCRQVESKRALIRVVRSPEGVRIDPTGKMAGRGAYLHDQPSCWERGLKGPLGQALKTAISEEDQKQLSAFVATLKEEPENNHLE